MKFAIATTVLTLALAMGTQGSIIPLHSEIAGHGLSYTAVSGPAVLPAAVAVHSPLLVHSGIHAWGHDDGQWHGDWHNDWAGHNLVHAHGHGPALVVDAHAHHPHVVIAAPHHEATYLAKTRGAVHSAPLAGHAHSAAAINVAAAPGTV